MEHSNLNEELLSVEFAALRIIKRWRDTPEFKMLVKRIRPEAINLLAEFIQAEIEEAYHMGVEHSEHPEENRFSAAYVTVT